VAVEALMSLSNREEVRLLLVLSSFDAHRKMHVSVLGNNYV